MIKLFSLIHNYYFFLLRGGISLCFYISNEDYSPSEHLKFISKVCLVRISYY